MHGLPGSQPMFLHFVDTQQYDSPTLPEADCQFAVGPSGEVSDRLNIYLNKRLLTLNSMSLATHSFFVSGICDATE